MQRVCVFCGSSKGSQASYLSAAQELAQALVANGCTLVYGGASVGLMGELADEVLRFGGSVIGVIPQSLVDKEVAHTGLTEQLIVQSMHERKATMVELANGFIAMPGGLGTLEELFEVLTWLQLGFHKKPCAALNVAQYFDLLTRFIEHAVSQAFVKEVHREMLLVDDDPAKLLDLMRSYRPPLQDKWIDFKGG